MPPPLRFLCNSGNAEQLGLTRLQNNCFNKILGVDWGVLKTLLSLDEYSSIGIAVRLILPKNKASLVVFTKT